ncbi:molybdate ABC transporter permease subunit, partial [Geobacillus stearothermophilus]|nr:molybdate ABC transporter permease subunit [Geobacillus stearothermophilus]
MEEFWSPVWLSINVSLLAGVIVAILGTAAARWMARRRFRGKTIVETVFMLPLVLPPSVVGFLLVVLFGRHSPIGQLMETWFHTTVLFTPG